MIRKPDQQERQGFWKADAWQAATAEPVVQWAGHDSKHPRLARAASMAGLAIFCLMAWQAGGIAVVAATLLLVTVWALVGTGLRRVLMYMSIRRYGAWQNMPREMQVVLDRPSDLAEPPAPFKPMPRGYRPKVAGVDDVPPEKAPWYVSLGKIMLLLVAMPFFGVAATYATDHPFRAIVLTMMLGAAFWFYRGTVRPEQPGEQ